jgi:hypothetical protein
MPSQTTSTTCSARVAAEDEGTAARNRWKRLTNEASDLINEILMG